MQAYGNNAMNCREWGCDVVNWTELTQDWLEQWHFVKKLINIWVP
jgi:hypothetical protein